MVLPLLFALGGQMLAASAGAGMLGVGLAAAGGNIVGQAIQNGGFRDLDLGSAALSGVGAGITAPAAAGAQAAGEAAKAGATEAAKTGLGGGIADAAKAAAASAPVSAPVNAMGVPMNIVSDGARAAAATPTPWFDKMINPETLMKTGGDMVGKYMENPIAMGAQFMGGMAAPVPKYSGSSNEKDQQEKQDMWNNAITGAMAHEANNNAFRYGARDPREWMRSAGIGPYYGQAGAMPYAPQGRTSVRGYAEGGVVPTGIGLNAMIDDAGKQQQQEFAQKQTQEMFDIAIMMVTGKLNKEEQAKAMQIMVDAMGEQKAMQYLQAVAESVKGQSGRVVAGQPSESDNVLAQDAQTGELIKLASGEGILPTGMVQAAGGGLAGMKNIVAAASKNLPEIRQPAKRFMQEAHA